MAAFGWGVGLSGGEDGVGGDEGRKGEERGGGEGEEVIAKLRWELLFPGDVGDLKSLRGEWRTLEAMGDGVLEEEDGLEVDKTKGVSVWMPLEEGEKDLVVAGEYEGGYQVWECSLDLVRVLGASKGGGKGVLGRVWERFRRGEEGLRLFEIGCGCGIPAFSVARWWREGGRGGEVGEGLDVVVQDLNADVLDIAARGAASAMLGDVDGDDGRVVRVVGVEGEWNAAMAEVEAVAPKFHLILTSETAYRTETIPALVTLIKSTLLPDGAALVATKRLYFGVGGGARAFESIATGKGLQVSRLAVFADGKSNVREILCVTHPKS